MAVLLLDAYYPLPFTLSLANMERLEGNYKVMLGNSMVILGVNHRMSR